MTIFEDLNDGDEFLDSLTGAPFIKTGMHTAKQVGDKGFLAMFDADEEVDLVKRG